MHPRGHWLKPPYCLRKHLREQGVNSLRIRLRQVSDRLEAWAGTAKPGHETESLFPAKTPGQLVIAKNLPSLELRRQDATAAARRIQGFATDVRPIGFFPGGSDESLAQQVNLLSWYHTIELRPGITTPGIYDHRPLVGHYGLPSTLAGLRALDVATADGFWAFELERRGAHVHAVDVRNFSDHDFPAEVREALARLGFDRPTGQGFELAKTALGSSVERHEVSVYDLPEAGFGSFDLVHMADVLLHLERPLDALRAVHSVTTGHALIAETVDAAMVPGGVRYLGDWAEVTYWLPSVQALGQMIMDAGFSQVDLHLMYSLAVTHVEGATGPWRAVFRALP